jgi:hypothetical protein
LRSYDLSAAEVAFHTASARRCGFHATLKAPFRLASNESEARFAPRWTPCRGDAGGIPRLVVSQSTASSRWFRNALALNCFADDVVPVDRFRAPLIGRKSSGAAPIAEAGQFRNPARATFTFSRPFAST